MNAKELSDLLGQKSERRIPKRLKRKKFTFACLAYEGTNQGCLERVSGLNRDNTGHVSTDVTVTEAISMEWSKLGVGWRFLEGGTGRWKKSKIPAQDTHLEIPTARGLKPSQRFGLVHSLDC